MRLKRLVGTGFGRGVRFDPGTRSVPSKGTCAVLQGRESGLVLFHSRWEQVALFKLEVFETIFYVKDC